MLEYKQNATNIMQKIVNKIMEFFTKVKNNGTPGPKNANCFES